jgi:hypothetical protein
VLKEARIRIRSSTVGAAFRGAVDDRDACSAAYPNEFGNSLNHAVLGCLGESREDRKVPDDATLALLKDEGAGGGGQQSV